MATVLLPPIENSTPLAMGDHIGVGFGYAGYSRDGMQLWCESRDDDYDSLPTVADVEQIAAADPDHDWRITFRAPLYDAVFQRQGEGLWAMIEEGSGFA